MDFFPSCSNALDAGYIIFVSLYFWVYTQPKLQDTFTHHRNYNISISQLYFNKTICLHFKQTSFSSTFYIKVHLLVHWWWLTSLSSECDDPGFLAAGESEERSGDADLVSSRPSLELLSLVITLPPDDSSLLCRSVNIRNFITEEKEITYHRAIVSSILSKI